MCDLSGTAVTAIMLLSVTGGIVGGYAAAQTGTAIVEKLWPSRSQVEGKPYPLAPIVGMPAFCAGFFLAFMVVSNIFRWLAC